MLNGRGGDDTLIGGDGDDLFVFEAGTGHDTLIGFSAGAGGPDKLDLRVFGFADFDAVIAASDDNGGTGPTVIDFGTGDSVTLVGVQMAQLHADDFLLF